MLLLAIAGGVTAVVVGIATIIRPLPTTQWLCAIGLLVVAFGAVGGIYASAARPRHHRVVARGSFLSLALGMALFGTSFATYSPPGRSLSIEISGPTVPITLYRDYINASVPSPEMIPPSTPVTVSCTTQGQPLNSNPSDDNWYRVASAPWENEYYAPADAFYNGAPTSAPFAHTPLVDPTVRACP